MARKIFVGSLPHLIPAESLMAEFSKYGTVEDVYVKPDCEPNRQWAFITFATHEMAQLAKDSCDRQLQFEGAERPCDVMLAKNQGMFGQEPLGAPAGAPPVAAPKKIFVGSLPDMIDEHSIISEFSKYGAVQEIYMKQGCPPGKQWCFVTFATPEEAQSAAANTNNVLQFAGAIRPCEVTLARNQGLFGQNPIAGGPQQGFAQQQMIPDGPKKVFVGTLPDYISDEMLRSEFGKYGNVVDIFIKPGCESGRQWAFVTYSSHAEAQFAKESTDRILIFPGSEKACEVTLARNQGKFGQDPINGQPGMGQMMQGGMHGGFGGGYAQAPVEGPKKIFVGSLPDGISDEMLRGEYSKYGQVTEIFIKMGDRAGRHWAFVSFATSDQAAHAKQATDRVLVFPGSIQPCEVKLAKNQGLFGQNPMGGGQPHMQAQQYMPHQGQVVRPPSHQGGMAVPPPQQGGGMGAPPPPQTPPPAHLTPWRMYKTVAGIPYYYNTTTGVTQWDTPPDLQPAAGAAGSNRYAPY
mmetsp:Transcript_13550/g.29674  ORF Transcript_13550/g.29674 Transcript_13550/m.29674 type:complete len:519 (+) Transcript_13550:153-1709(+)|eukprot:CAMPEP_0206444350 /NCGR_PEP_ID=MMETSP0324_2-20121206/14864_1 /ASSEMBLY_ACC=CAM_ASM_000836 /TAXON_ID=2866 /ORGANISM="Crypthecodinium cohnii, Strain Seligo" /LENGTH=518 /DNA_ID=CAMNT_0053912365 /DNA_START=152 /DNA_END=1708 /DNA_ORIENTATION=+